MGYSPFELVFGHEVRGPLQLLREKIIRPAPPGDVLDYVSLMRGRLQLACEVASKNLAGAKACMKARYDRKAVCRVFDPGDLVLVLGAGRSGTSTTLLVPQRGGLRPDCVTLMP